MKCLCFADLHIGKKQSNSFFLDLDKQVIDRICQEVKKGEVKKVIFLGDFFHNRNESTPKAMVVGREILDQLNGLGIPIVMILGNHCTYYNSSKDFNYYRIFDGLFPNIRFVENILQDGELLHVGWMQTPEEEEKYKQISKNYKWIFGHFEFKGAEMSEHYRVTSGLENDNPEAHIFSGHIHQRSKQGRLHYIGSPYPQTWHSRNRKDHGYVLVDTIKEEIKYVDLGLYYFNEYKLQNLLMMLKMDRNKMKKEIGNSETKVKIDVPLDEKQLADIKFFLNTFHPKSLLVEKESDTMVVENIAYESLSLSNPTDFITEYIAGLKIDENQKARVLEKVKAILKQ